MSSLLQLIKMIRTRGTRGNHFIFITQEWGFSGACFLLAQNMVNN